ncbi:DNA polymerase III subunit delta' [Sphingomonas sp.]|uniref:DNA polymerase III subunit delta' n=1 Tax=Sphingomonas sp. TaxID=28214 RepID=UPI002C4AF63E|nr:DNA polymerase III subunit delta' [Sphingomonas sp.]HTG38375.1 DNA polymerase III subunit delta' [Sphingomonas sp.]
MTGPIGNDTARAAFARAVEGGALHHAWLIAGPEGVGKGSFARHAAAVLLARALDPALPADAPVSPDHRVAHLLASGAHPDYRELVRLPKDAAKPDDGLARGITIAQVRALQPMFATKPALSERRVVVIDAIDDLERGASNALLKNLEEPPVGTIFLLVSHAPGRLLPTIRSRCRMLRFGALSDAEVERVLERQAPDASAQERAALARAGAGSPGRALAFAGLDMDEIDRELALIADTGDVDNAARGRLRRQLSARGGQARYAAFVERVPGFIAERARGAVGERLRTALNAHDDALRVGGIAMGLSLDIAGTVFELCGIVARLSR